MLPTRGVPLLPKGGFPLAAMGWAVDFMLFEVVDYAIIYALHYAFWGSAICYLCRGKSKENDTFRTLNSLSIEG